MRQKQQALSLEEEIEAAWREVVADLQGRINDPKRKEELAEAYRGIDRNYVKGSSIAESMKDVAKEIARWPDWMRRLKERRE